MPPINSQQTWSQMPINNSKVIDAGSCTLATDQNSLARRQGNGCDIGAVETVLQGGVYPGGAAVNIAVMPTQRYNEEAKITNKATDTVQVKRP